jgi:hypothetical protein
MAKWMRPSSEDAVDDAEIAYLQLERKQDAE